MPPLSRKQFFEKLLAQTPAEVTDGRDDAAFKRHANKLLPEFKKTTTTTLAPYAGPWGEAQVRHLLRRTMFGVKYEDVQTLRGLSMSDAVDLLLNMPAKTPAPPVNDYTADGTADFTGVATGDTWVTAPYGSGSLDIYRIYSYKGWWLRVMMEQNLSIIEKMVFFWHNHFATQALVVLDGRFSYVHNVMLRQNALGNFRELVRMVTKDCSMLRYLNGYQNTKNLPDENYGRELQELFTVGKNNATNYSENDVKAAAHVLTGWNVNISNFQSFFTSQEHDTGDKTFSAFYNNTVIAGQTGANGANETDQLIDMIFTRPEAAHFICTKLYRFFVYYDIDDNIEQNIIQPMADMLVANNYEIKPVLRALLKSEHFFDSYSMGCYIKTPMDIVAGSFRTLGVGLPKALSVTEQGMVFNYLRDQGLQMGLDLGDPPNVAGWAAFYESPAFHQLWINSSTLPIRMQFCDMLLGTGFNTGTSATVVADTLGFVKQFEHPEDPDLLVAWLTDMLLGLPVSDTELASLKSILLSGQLSNNYWSSAWVAYMLDPNEGNTALVLNRLQPLLTTICRLPEFQLC